MTSYFYLNKTNGKINNTKPVDYEVNHVIKFTIHVEDCTANTNATCNGSRNEEEERKQIAEIDVIINVIDVNDNPPSFIKERIATGMVHGTEPGDILGLKLKNESYVKDMDSKRNAADSWHFSNDGNVSLSQGLLAYLQPGTGVENCTDGQKHLFCVTPNGTIISNKIIDETLAGYFTVPIIVRDKAGFDKANVTIYLISRFQILTMIIRGNKEQVSVNIDQIMSEYSAITGKTFVYDKLSNHKKSNGDVVTTSSDLEFHVVDPETQKDCWAF
ncbi:cadherin-87A-like [Mya arenaria]|uniref:cadherin-87A-like n=1 Tax=Mya arenaria TaxID=6604 RepID=UPI0022E215C5|nr:cadherin-87A-like [Mya arenaria]